MGNRKPADVEVRRVRLSAEATMSMSAVHWVPVVCVPAYQGIAAGPKASIATLIICGSSRILRLFGTATRQGKTVKVEIYSSGKNDWILEVVDEDNNSTVWHDQFETDDEAFQEFERTLKKEGHAAIL
jgi:hypothetical protein